MQILLDKIYKNKNVLIGYLYFLKFNKRRQIYMFFDLYISILYGGVDPKFSDTLLIVAIYGN